MNGTWGADAYALSRDPFFPKPADTFLKTRSNDPVLT